LRTIEFNELREEQAPMSDDDQEQQPPPEASTEERRTEPPAEPPAGDAPAERAGRTIRIPSGRLAVAAAATALVVVSGFGGFVLGHATADDGPNWGHQEPRMLRDGDGPGFRDGRPPYPPDFEGRLPQDQDEGEQESGEDDNSDT
jgi:hypothetical protein